MSTIATMHCDSPECTNTATNNVHGWVTVKQGASHQDFCSWACVAVFAKVRWEPRQAPQARRRTDAPVKTVDPSYLCDAVQPPLPGVPS